jgi:hypothetical protein
LYHKIEKKTLMQLGEENNIEGAFTLGVRYSKVQSPHTMLSHLGL